MQFALGFGGKLYNVLGFTIRLANVLRQSSRLRKPSSRDSAADD